MPSEANIIVEDIEFLRHGERPLLLTLYLPAGDGPFPLVIDLHGGAWNKGERAECAKRDTVLAQQGIAAAALDFRHAADGYPSSLIDINYAIRWLKAKAGALNLQASRFGLSGQSSGGHLAMLTAMRPSDPRYGSLALPAGFVRQNANVQCVVMTWPVINPLSRYHHALRQRASASPPDWVGDIPERHDIYWPDEETMAEGNPTMALERGETVSTPPTLWVQGRPDPVHDYNDPNSDFPGNEPDRFAARYRAAGGKIEIANIEQETRVNNTTDHLVAAFCKLHLTAGLANTNKFSAA
jgi:acetyl esterase/lipase